MIEIIKNKTEEILSLLENTGYFLINEQSKKEYKTFTKDDGSLLTELDIASEYLIKHELKSMFGNIEVLSEENSLEENVKITNNKYFFILDPIDGTTFFNKGKEFTINLAFCIDKKPVISFIHNPIKKIMLFGDENKAFKRTGGKIIELKKVKEFDKYNAILKGKQPLRLTIGVHMMENKLFVDDLIKEVQNSGYNFSKYTLKSASAMGKILRIVNNETDAIITSTKCNDWDILPAFPILQAIGANYLTNNEYVYKNNNFNQGRFIAGCGQELIEDLDNILYRIENKS